MKHLKTKVARHFLISGKAILLFFLLNLHFTKSEAQLKVTNNGRVAIGQNFASSAFKLTVNSGEICALNLINSSRTLYSWTSNSHVEIDPVKSWIVSQNGKQKFWVYGNGQIWASQIPKFSDSTLKTNNTPIIDCVRIIDSLQGEYFYYSRQIWRHLGGIMGKWCSKIQP